MLYVQFIIDEKRYLIATNQVEMLMPVVQIQKMAQSSDLYPGCINFRGEWLPVIDLVQLFGNRPARLRLSTRIIIATLQGDNRRSRKAGLVVEKVSDLIRLDESSFTDVSSEQPNNYVLDAQTHDENGVLHRVQADYFVTQLPALNDCDELIHA